jgi:hypothetical protein
MNLLIWMQPEQNIMVARMDASIKGDICNTNNRGFGEMVIPNMSRFTSKMLLQGH